jgi:predicted amidophosphoribosyltransferase
LYSQIGKMYYESGEYDPETTLGRLCIAIKASFDRIAKHTEEIRQIKGTMRCPNCGEDIPLNSAFCGVCGTRIEQTAGFTPTAAAAKTCASCGAVVPEGSMFCTGCGQRQ